LHQGGAKPSGLFFYSQAGWVKQQGRLERKKMDEAFICETPGCPEEGKTSDSVTCSSCGKARSRVKLKLLTKERGLKLSRSEYERI
jgi:hypothetical protein